ncbi:MarR family transcriptional regulator [uncultured Brevibacillus sp.]|uniref:MarR family transcriptional regulator n=1 Tax=uncultured Brevibacillus sp. TaxID=169970 RepID=UPI002597A049|nr:MarR family transcriptional regulator [uncultured Brevibacillus sp.]
MDIKNKVWNQWVTMLHKQEERSKHREAILLAQIKKDLPDYDHAGDISITELHVIQAIGNHKAMNVTSIAHQIGVTKSAISKITARLIKKELIERYQLADNQKEVFFSADQRGESWASPRCLRITLFYCICRFN